MADVDLVLKKVHIKNKQRFVDKRFAEEGLTDEILSMQIEINMMRHELDIADGEHVIFNGFVQ